MKDSIFSFNEVNFLKNPNNFSKKNSRNYIYQIRYSIRKKVSDFVKKDLDLLLNLGEFGKKNEELIDHYLMGYLIIKLIKKYPYSITKILNLSEIKDYLSIK